MDGRRTVKDPPPLKRDSFAAQLDNDTSASSSQQRLAEKTQAFQSKMMKSALERRLIAAEDKRRELESALREKDIVIERLESDRRWLSERETEEREERERMEEEWEEERKRLEETSKTLRHSLTTLQAEHADLQDSQSTLQRTTTSTIASQKSTLTVSERKTALLEEELSRTKELAEERALTIRQMRERMDEMESERDASIGTRAENENWSIVRDELHRQSHHLRTVEAANAKLNSELTTLRARHQMVEVLKEEKRNLEKKLKKAEEVKDKVVKLEGEVEAARKERADWAKFLTDPSAEPTSHTPTALTQALSTLRLNYASLLEQQGSVNSLLALREAELAEAVRRDAEARQRCTQLEDAIRKESERALKRERRAALAERESSGLRALMATFTAEETMTEGAFDEVKNRRILQLEELLEDYKTNAVDLEKSLDEASRRGGGEPSRKEVEDAVRAETERRLALKQELAEANKESVQLTAKIDTLEQRLFELGAQIAGGNHVPPNTRVIQLQQNPASEHFNLRREELNRLKAENEALLAQIAELERGGAAVSGSGMVPRESWDNMRLEKEGLIETVAQKEKRLMRLKEVFSAKAVEFREAVSSILGYKLAFQSTRVRLTSMYDLTASIVFDSKSKDDIGTMNIVGLGDGGQGGPPTLKQLMDFWVFERGSIPCFLAALTIECYELSTRGRSAGWVVNDTSSSESMNITQG